MSGYRVCLGAVWLLSSGAGQWQMQGVPTAGLSSVAIDGCAWECLCLSLEKGVGSPSTLAETTPPLNVLLFLPVVCAAQPSLLCLDLSIPGLSQITREAPDETMVWCV